MQTAQQQDLSDAPEACCSAGLLVEAQETLAVDKEMNSDASEHDGASSQSTTELAEENTLSDSDQDPDTQVISAALSDSDQDSDTQDASVDPHYLSFAEKRRIFEEQGWAAFTPRLAAELRVLLANQDMLDGAEVSTQLWQEAVEVASGLCDETPVCSLSVLQRCLKDRVEITDDDAWLVPLGGNDCVRERLCSDATTTAPSTTRSCSSGISRSSSLSFSLEDGLSPTRASRSLIASFEMEERSSFPGTHPRVDWVLVDAICASFPALRVAARNTSKHEYEALALAGARCQVDRWRSNETFKRAVSILNADLSRTVMWTKSPQAGSTTTWALPPLDSGQLELLRKVLHAFAARSDQLMAAGSLRIRAHYIQGWNHLARLILLTTRFDDHAAFCIFEGLMLDYGMAHFADTETGDQLWIRVFSRYDQWYGSNLGTFGGCLSAQHFFRGVAGSALQMSGFALGMPPLTAVKILTFIINAGVVGAAVRLEELLTGALARMVRLSTVRPCDLDMREPRQADKAMMVARECLHHAFVSRGLNVAGQLRIAHRLRQRELYLWARDTCLVPVQVMEIFLRSAGLEAPKLLRTALPDSVVKRPAVPLGGYVPGAFHAFFEQAQRTELSY